MRPSFFFGRALAALAALALPAFAQEATQERRLDNGLDLLVVEKHKAPIVTIEIAVKTGAFTEDRETNGLSHLYEHMFFKGNAAIPTQEAYMRRMQELGIRFNGTTGDERVNYFVTLPSKNFAAGMKFMSDALLTPLFNQEELEKEREVVIGEYDRNESSPEYYLHVGIAKAAYGDEYLRKNPLGERATILSATRETMVKFKETYYVPNNSMLSIVGDVNPTEAASLGERYFGATRWKEAEDPHKAHPKPPLPRLGASKAVLVGRQGVAVPVLAAVWNGPDTDRDTHGTYVADVWETLVGQRSGRFQKALKDSGLATSARLGAGTQRDGAEISFHAQLLKPASEVREALLKEIQAMAEDAGYFSDEELANAKHAIQVDRALEEQESVRLSHSLTYAWATASLDYWREYVPETGRVELAEVRAFVKHYLLGRPYVIGLLLEKDEAAKTDEPAVLGVAPEQRGSGIDSSAVETFTTKNGIKVVSRVEPGPLAALEVFFDGGSQLLTKETQGLERLAFATALDGSKEFPRDELRKQLETLGARFGHESGYDYSRVGVSSLAENLSEGLRALVSCLREPEMQAASLEQKRTEILQGLKRENQVPDALLAKMSNEIFFAGHAYENRPDGTPETIAKLDADACRAAVARAAVPSRMLVVVVSPLSHEDARALVETAFSWVKPGNAPERAALGPAAPKERSRFFQKKLPTTYVMGKFPAPAPTDPSFTATKVLMTILHERLWDAIRTKRALSYAPQARLGGLRANYGIVYVTAKDPRKSIEVMFDEMAKLKDELVTPAELKAVLAGDATSRAQQSENASAHANALGRYELLHGGWKHLYGEPLALQAVTAEQVRDAARKLLADVRWSFVGPEPLEEKLLERN